MALGFLDPFPEHCAVSEDAETFTLTVFMGGDPTLLPVKIDYIHINTVGQFSQNKDLCAASHGQQRTCCGHNAQASSVASTLKCKLNGTANVKQLSKKDSVHSCICAGDSKTKNSVFVNLSYVKEGL